MSFDTTGEWLRVSGTVKESVVDGPGLRFVVFSQGCLFGCEGCHNVHAQALDGGTVVTVDALADQIRDTRLVTGVTFSGGEPMLQAAGFAALGRRVRGMGLDVVIFTGYTWDELKDLALRDVSVADLLDMSWLVVDGRFAIAEKDLSLAFRGSANQRVIDVHRTWAEGAIVQWQPRV